MNSKFAFFLVVSMSFTVSVSVVASESVQEGEGSLNQQSLIQLVEQHGDKTIGGYERMNEDGNIEQSIYSVSVLLVDGAVKADLHDSEPVN